MFGAADDEIVNALRDVEGVEGIGDFTGPEYVFSVKEMFQRRGF